MSEALEKAINGIIGSGPLAAVLLYAIVVLWRENKDLQARLLAVLEGIAGVKEEKK